MENNKAYTSDEIITTVKKMILAQLSDYIEDINVDIKHGDLDVIKIKPRDEQIKNMIHNGLIFIDFTNHGFALVCWKKGHGNNNEYKLTLNVKDLRNLKDDFQTFLNTIITTFSYDKPEDSADEQAKLTRDLEADIAKANFTNVDGKFKRGELILKRKGLVENDTIGVCYELGQFNLICFINGKAFAASVSKFSEIKDAVSLILKRVNVEFSNRVQETDKSKQTTKPAIANTEPGDYPSGNSENVILPDGANVSPMEITLNAILDRYIVDSKVNLDKKGDIVTACFVLREQGLVLNDFVVLSRTAKGFILSCKSLKHSPIETYKEFDDLSDIAITFGRLLDHARKIKYMDEKAAKIYYKTTILSALDDVISDVVVEVGSKFKLSRAVITLINTGEYDDDEIYLYRTKHGYELSCSINDNSLEHHFDTLDDIRDAFFRLITNYAFKRGSEKPEKSLPIGYILHPDGNVEYVQMSDEQIIELYRKTVLSVMTGLANDAIVKLGKSGNMIRTTITLKDQYTVDRNELVVFRDLDKFTLKCVKNGSVIRVRFDKLSEIRDAYYDILNNHAFKDGSGRLKAPVKFNLPEHLSSTAPSSFAVHRSEARREMTSDHQAQRYAFHQRGDSEMGRKLQAEEHFGSRNKRVFLFNGLSRLMRSNTKLPFKEDLAIDVSGNIYFIIGSLHLVIKSKNGSFILETKPVNDVKFVAYIKVDCCNLEELLASIYELHLKQPIAGKQSNELEALILNTRNRTNVDSVTEFLNIDQTLSRYVDSRDGTASDIGLSNISNTNDFDKPYPWTQHNAAKLQAASANQFPEFIKGLDCGYQVVFFK